MFAVALRPTTRADIRIVNVKEFRSAIADEIEPLGVKHGFDRRPDFSAAESGKALQDVHQLILIADATLLQSFNGFLNAHARDDLTAVAIVCRSLGRIVRPAHCVPAFFAASVNLWINSFSVNLGSARSLNSRISGHASLTVKLNFLSTHEHA